VENAAPSSVFRKEGEYWTIVYDGVVCRLRDSKGLQHLACLLRHPGAKVPAVQLVAASEVSGAGCRVSDFNDGSAGHARRISAVDERARLTVTKGIKTALARIEAAHPTLAQHLQATIHRGYLCSYVPDPRLPIAWET
jgi:hypothetical protein